MKEIICIVLFFISGILIYQILKLLCKCHLTEGYGDFGRVSLGKCCPKGYKYSTTMKKCVHICDACDPSVYNKLKYVWKKYPGDTQKQLHPTFDCDEHDASTVHDFDSINRRYTKDDLLDQNDYGGWNMNSDFFTASVPSASGVEDSTAGVQASEEGGNETWAGITGDAASGRSGRWQETSTDQQYYFDEIPEELYYTSQEECIEDYTNFSSIPNKGNPPEAPGLYVNGSLVDGADCRGYWKLDMEDQRFNYLKDGDRSIAQPSWRVYTKRTGTSRNPGYDQSIRGVQGAPTFQEYKSSNLPMVKRYIDGGILNPNSPVYEYYNNNFHKLRCDDSPQIDGYECPEEDRQQESESITKTLNDNRDQFCYNLITKHTERIFQGENTSFADISLISNIDSSDNDNPTMRNLCIVDNDESKTNSWNTLCNNMNYSNINRDINDAFIYETSATDESGQRQVNILCESKEGIEYICQGVDEYTPDPTKTFCQE